MKKSNALMLSYILILVLTLVADKYFEWNGINQVALAATAAGCFFAIADFWGWAASFGQPLINAQKEYHTAYKIYLNEILERAKKDRDARNHAAELLQPHVNSFESIKELLDSSEELIHTIEKAEEVAKEALGTAALTDSDIEKREKRNSRQKWLEIIFATCGFLAFFILIVFSSMAELLLPLSSGITVITFVVIMLNYFLKDVLEDLALKEVNEINANCENVKERTSLHTGRDTEAFLQSVEDIASRIREYENEKEAAENG